VGVLTVRGVEDDLSAALKAEAAERKISVNALVVRMLKEAVGFAEPSPTKPRDHHDLDFMFGTWSPEEAAQFDQVIEEEFEQIDWDDWK
jgi:hypothetical protein